MGDMTIKIIGKSYQLNNLKAVIEFDLDGETYTREVEASISQVLGMTVDEIKTWVRNFVANQRRELQLQAVNALIDPLLDVDIEV